MFYLYRVEITILVIYFCRTISPVELTSIVKEDVVINEIVSSIDLSSQLVIMHHRINFVSKSVDVKSFIFTVDPLLVTNLAYITARDKINTEFYLPLKNHDNGVWEIMLKNPAPPNNSCTVIVRTVYTHFLKPFPAKVKQFEKHLVIYNGPISLYTPYVSHNHTTYFRLGEGSIINIIHSNFSFSNDSVLKFNSTDKKVEPNTNSNVKIHYEHKHRFLTVKSLHRTIEISHWGNIAITEKIELEHCGAKFYGPFHRSLFNNNKDKDLVIEYIITVLPASATDISVYDEIGIISSISIKDNLDSILMKFSPRFVLLGGWKVSYIISYNVPSYEYLYNKNDEYKLNMRVIDHIFDNMVIDEAIVQIILPEGTDQFLLELPYSVKHLNNSEHISLLDIVGKPVIAFMKKNLIEAHIQNFVLSYRFSKYAMVFEPLYIIIFEEIIFIVFIIFKRLNFTISKDGQENIFKVQSEITVSPVVKEHMVKAKKKRH